MPSRALPDRVNVNRRRAKAARDKVIPTALPPRRFDLKKAVAILARELCI